MPDLTADADIGVEIDVSKLPTFDKETIHDARAISIFRGPLLVVRKSPPAGYGRIPVHVCDDDLVYSETFYGYSATGHSDASRFVRYLALAIGSKPAFWLSLITSGEFGFEREVVEKTTIDGLLAPAFTTLSADDLDKVDRLFECVADTGNEAAWSEVDSWIAELYGLSTRDLQVIDDTLEFGLPFSENQKKAQRPPSSGMVKNFCQVLESELAPWADDAGRTISVAPSRPDRSPWLTLAIRSEASSPRMQQVGGADWPRLIGAADKLAATEMVYQDDVGQCLWLARLAQARYWSETQARLAAQRIVWTHIDWLTGGVA